MNAMDAISWAALVLLPVWIAGGTALFRALLDCTIGQGRWGMPVYMGLGLPLILILVGVPVSFLMRHLDRLYDYESCVTHGHVGDRLNQCPEWTIDVWNQRKPKP